MKASLAFSLASGPYKAWGDATAEIDMLVAPEVGDTFEMRAIFGEAVDLGLPDRLVVEGVVKIEGDGAQVPHIILSMAVVPIDHDIELVANNLETKYGVEVVRYSDIE